MATAVVQSPFLRESAHRLSAYSREAFKVGLTLIEAEEEAVDCICALSSGESPRGESCRAFLRELRQTASARPRQRCPGGFWIIARPVGGNGHGMFLATGGFLEEGEAPGAERAGGARGERDIPRLPATQVRLLDRFLGASAELMEALERFPGEGAHETLREEIWREEAGAPSLVGSTPGMRALRESLPSLANSREPLLIAAEPGSGRHLLASTVHRMGPWRDRPFLVENLAQLPEALHEAELFGRQDEHRPGLIEEAAGGTLFLAGIEHLSAAAQKRLLEYLADGRAPRPSRRKSPLPAVRVIAAAERPLEEQVRRGGFRSDLMRRLSTLTAAIPPLRERAEDVPLLTAHLLRRLGRRWGTPVPGVEPEAADALRKYQWPGNVRELEEELTRAATGRVTLRLEDLSGQLVRSARPPRPLQADLRQAVGELETDLIGRTLADTNWNKSQAARILGLSRLGLQKKIDRYDLDRRR